MPRSSRRKISEWVKQRGWRHAGPREWEELRTAFPENSANLFNAVLAEAAIGVEQPFRGVDTGSLEGLEKTLRELSACYAAQPADRRLCRELVIAAKDRARFASRGVNADPEKRALKARMVEWMLVWLDDPSVFPVWATLRQAADQR